MKCFTKALQKRICINHITVCMYVIGQETAESCFVVILEVVIIELIINNNY